MTRQLEIAVPSVAGSPPDLDDIERVLLLRLRSIGDTVLMTPCIDALHRWRPELEIDVALAPFCAPLLQSHPLVRHVEIVGRSAAARIDAARRFRRAGYELVINLSGSTTASLLTRASGARIRVGFAGYRAAWLANCRVTSSHHVWRRTNVHTVEHQLALVGGIGVPVSLPAPTSLATDPEAASRVDEWLGQRRLQRFVLLHVEASAPDKTWPAENFALLARRLRDRHGLTSIVLGVCKQLVATVVDASRGAAVSGTGFALGEVMALAERCTVFAGNDSGPAHIAAAYARPVVVVFGASNQTLWRPWSLAPWRVVAAARAQEVAVASVEAAVGELVGEGA
jgi:ADP-heptose:LPS heptosyltransferase